MHLIIPNHFDVLCTRDRTYNDHPGNKRYKALINSKFQLYERSTKKDDRMALNRKIIQTMKNDYDTRFLTINAGEWEELQENKIMDKISHAFRFAIRKARKDRARTNSVDSNTTEYSSGSESEASEHEEDREQVAAGESVPFNILSARQGELLRQSKWKGNFNIEQPTILGVAAAASCNTERREFQVEPEPNFIVEPLPAELDENPEDAEFELFPSLRSTEFVDERAETQDHGPSDTLRSADHEEFILEASVLLGIDIGSIGSIGSFAAAVPAKCSLQQLFA